MADWSALPTDLLYSISLRLPTSTDLLRFRSVCAAWRSAVNPPLSAYHYPIIPGSGISYMGLGFFLTKRTIYTLQSTLPHLSSSWIIKLERDNNNRMRLFYPLTQFEYKPLPQTFPKSFNFMNFRVKELGEEYTLHYIMFGPSANSIAKVGNIYREKVAVLNNSGDEFVLLAIHVSGKLVVYKSGDEKWRPIVDFPSTYDDVILRGGRFYAVDNTGRVVLVNHVDLNVNTVSNSTFGGYKKFLIDSDGELLLVDMYLSCVPGNDSVYNEPCHRKFKVFRLDENAGKWIEASDLGDRMLFLGDRCMFSISAVDTFGVVRRRGNRIFFMDRVLKMFDFESGSTETLGSRFGYHKMFWPPPHWVYSAAPIDVGVNQLSI